MTRLRDPLRASVLLLTALLLAVATACGGSDDDDGTTSEAAAPATTAEAAPASEEGSGSAAEPTTEAAAADASSEEAPAGPSGSLTVDIATPPASMDPAAVCSIEDMGLLSDLYVTMVKHPVVGDDPGAQQTDPTQIVPYLAESWEISEDGKVYTFHLRQDAVFPSGNPVDSEAVKWSWERALAIGSCGAYFLNANGVDLLQTIETPDPHTVVVTLSQPNVNFLQALTASSTAIVDPSVLQQHGSTPEEQNQWLASNFAGSGPYVLKSYEPGTSAVYEANPTFFGDPPRTQTITINFVPNDETLLLRARGGDADVTLGLTKQSVASLEGESSLRIVSTPAAAWQLVSFPHKLPPFDNAKLREALTYAVPYQDILDQVAHGYGQLFYGPFPPVFPEYDETIGAPRPTDLEKAKALLAESGVQGPITLELYTREGVNEQQQIATILQSAWKELGVDVKITQLAAAQYQEAVTSTEKTYGLIRFDGPSIPNAGWLVGYDNTCGSPFNASNYCNERADELFGQALQTTDDAERQRLWNELAELWVADAPRVPLYAQNFTAVMKSDVTHYVFAQNDLFFHLWGR